MNDTTIIYGLIDPRTELLRYVGKANDLRRRMYGHLFNAKNGELTRKARWIKGLLDSGLRPEVITLEVVPMESWQAAECFWIAYFRSIGCPLVNHCDGGKGTSGLDAEARQRISDRLRGKPTHPRTSEIVTARNRSPDFWSPEVRRAASEAQKRRFSRDGHPNAGKILAPSIGAAVGRANANRVHSPETCQKLSEATKRRNAKHGLPDNRKHYLVISPEGERHEVHGLRPFCAQFGLDAPTMTNIANGKSKSGAHKGWRCFPVTA